MHYRFTFPHRVSRFAEIELTIEDLDGAELHLQLPSWRPGRYELGNFAKNIRGWKALDDKGNLLPSKKISKDSWVVQLEGAKKVTVRYEYYCSQADAGACWVDEEMVYINPIHCCLYVPERLPLNCRLELVVPDDHRIACSLEPAGKNTFVASSYHELVDSPFIASPSLRHKSYETNGLGITERAVQGIVGDLEAAGVIVRERQGRRNSYRLNLDPPLRHPLEAHRSIRSLLAVVLAPTQLKRLPTA